MLPGTCQGRFEIVQVVLDGRPVAFFERHCDEGWGYRNHPQVVHVFQLVNYCNTDWWFGTFLIVPFRWECHHPN